VDRAAYVFHKIDQYFGQDQSGLFQLPGENSLAQAGFTFSDLSRRIVPPAVGFEDV
jgi:hypothetical protein